MINKNQIIKEYQNVTDLLAVKRFWDAIQKMKNITSEINSEFISNTIEKLSSTYTNILKYSLDYKDDPERNNIYFKLARDLFELNDSIKSHILTQLAESGENTSSYSQSGYTAGNLTEVTDQILKYYRNAVVSDKLGDSNYEQQLIKHYIDVFNAVYNNINFDEEDEEAVKNIIKSGIPWYIKCLIVSAITISCLSFFDSKKIRLLIEIYQDSDEQIWHRAVIGIFILTVFYEKRLQYYPELIHRIKSVQNYEQFQKHIEAIHIQFLKAQETEKITKKIQEEIIPEVMKMKTDLEDKLNLKDLLSSENFEDKNPEWENVFKDSPDVYNKLEEFSMMQLEGSDVFMSAFAMLKRFDFFNEMSNWFLPFYKENIMVDDALLSVKDGFDVNAFVEGMERSSVLCNSDKYSFCLNVKHMPDMQKSMMLELFNMELKAMNEMASEEHKHNVNARNKVIFTQYIQDLYRFYKLYPGKKNYDDIFSVMLDIPDSWILNLYFDNDTLKRNIGEYFFEKQYFNRALGIFKSLSNIDQSFELTEKIGYCYQKMNQYKKALEYYKKAELFDRNKLWLLKKIAFCHRRLGEFKNALTVYREVERLEPENLINQAYLGQLHIDLEDFEEALKYYYKVEYIDNKNTKVHRPLAWCSFMTGKLDNAEKYMTKVIEKDPTKDDYMNYGHILWSKGSIKSAGEMYTKSYSLSGKNKEWFINTMLHDSTFLKAKGIEPVDISIMIDSVFIQD